MKTSARAAVSALWAASMLLWGCATTGPAPPAPPVHPNGQALWRIVHDHCLVDQHEHGLPAPCAEVAIAQGEDHGFVVLKDRDGATQYLVMPTRLITGIEDAQVLAPDATNYFAPAWATRHQVEDRLGARLPRDDVSVAVNSIYGRSQDLLHLHVDCLRADVRDALRVDAPQIGPDWSARTFSLAGHPYRIERIPGDDLGAINPFKRLAQGMAVPRAQMGAWTLVLAGATFDRGQPGFYLMAARADPLHGETASGEALQDHDCVGRGPAAGRETRP
jgi:CDP-diacylglycerol pyrophosphatase